MSEVRDPRTLEDCQRLLEAGDYETVIQELKPRLDSNHQGAADALLGIAYLRTERHDLALRHLEAAVRQGPNRDEWNRALRLARANVTSEVHVPVPEFYFFERERLLAPPVVSAGTLPPAPPPAPALGWFATTRNRVGNAIGAIATALMHALTQIVGRLAGYRDAVWTNWYRRPMLLGVLTLAHMRDLLNEHNLKNTYPSGALTGFVPQGLEPPPGVTHFRTADGTWNNLQNPKEGAAGTRFTRNVSRAAIRPDAPDDLMSPNPREVSRVLLTREGPMPEVPFLNMLAASWIQFQNHDWISHGEVLQRDVWEIPLAEDDPGRKRYWQAKMFVGKTQPDPTRTDHPDEPAITFINEVTHWWDGSQIYGSDQATVDRLRSHRDGKLRLNPDGTLPVDSRGVEDTGFVRNWWIGLAMLHTIFAREHNAICDHLRAAHPDWDDNRLFNVARLVNAAVMAKIHSVEWTPSILPNRTLSEGLHANWYGLLTNLLRAEKDRKTVADINVRNPELGGVVGNPIDRHGQPFGLTEEFVEVYRLHSLLPEHLQLRRRSGDGAVTEVHFPATRQAASPRVTRQYSMPDLFYSFGNQHPGQLVLNNFPAFMQELSIPGNPLFDMGAVDILRARERGVPRYNEFRRQLGLNPIRSFEDLTDDRAQVERLRRVYGDRPEDVERLDLMIGTLGEGHRPTGFGFGETMFQIFILNATRRLQADRFYTDGYTAEYYTPEGLRWVDEATLKSVLLRHYPELAGTGLANVKNAFEPWDVGPRLDPARHPLRSFDKDLKGDRWACSVTRVA